MNNRDTLKKKILFMGVLFTIFFSSCLSRTEAANAANFTFDILPEKAPLVAKELINRCTFESFSDPETNERRLVVSCWAMDVNQDLLNLISKDARHFSAQVADLQQAYDVQEELQMQGINSIVTFDQNSGNYNITAVEE